ncbi:uncharacterized protein BP5553_06968 [Venustampulla echinocandica]|uniref:RNase MRP protein 1 RNA binding domain-containing protein n=1 Tax=Venustampulla echinocandica TaxID=2656787 RepID=A0A370TI61_9HELO|nr:uncharacterized protein BP5553_06968 [Venustampulla echinocandica]RDL35037.1 hypothetical protein BP5553_06968 [Venustampulla echinocandica]
MSTFTALIQNLTALYSTLHLFHHRNKNQHRLSKWYFYFSQFRRQVQKLVKEIEAYDAARKLSAKSRFTREAEERLRARIGLLAGVGGGGASDGMVGDWFLAFSTLVADNQYSTLGLMLLGSLARFQSLLVDAGSEVGIEVDLVVGSQVESEGVKELLLVEGEQRGYGDDLGEVVERAVLKDLVGVEKEDDMEDKIKDEDVDDGVVDSKKRKKRKQDFVGSKTERLAKSTPTQPLKKKKKKREKGDAFDDLFGGLI